MTESVPLHVEKALKRYDRNLRLRFSRQARRWFLERKCARRLLQPPIVYYEDPDGRVREELLPENSDVYIQYKDGYVKVLEIGYPTMELIRQLWENDSSRYGARFVRMLQEKWERDEERKQRKRMSALCDPAGDIYDSLRWRQGSRTRVSGLRE